MQKPYHVEVGMSRFTFEKLEDALAKAYSKYSMVADTASIRIRCHTDTPTTGVFDERGCIRWVEGMKEDLPPV